MKVLHTVWHVINKNKKKVLFFDDDKNYVKKIKLRKKNIELIKNEWFYVSLIFNVCKMCKMVDTKELCGLLYWLLIGKNLIRIVFCVKNLKFTSNTKCDDE